MRKHTIFDPDSHFPDIPSAYLYYASRDLAVRTNDLTFEGLEERYDCLQFYTCAASELRDGWEGRESPSTNGLKRHSTTYDGMLAA